MKTLVNNSERRREDISSLLFKRKGLFLFAFLFLFIFNTAGQIAPVNVPSGGFHIDGGLQSNTPTMDVGDWVQGVSGSGGFVINLDGTVIDSTTTQHFHDAYNTTADFIFQGSKFNDSPNNWSWTNGKASSKNDINNAAFHVSKDSDDNAWLMVCGDRLSTTGTSYIDFEFFQKSVERDPNGGFISAGTDGGRTIDDMVISMEYSNGGSVANVHFYLWKPDGSGGFSYIEHFFPPSVTFAITNLVNEPVPYGAFGNTSYDPFQFVEAAINVTALFGSVDPCLGISVKTIMIKTKASDSETAALGDFVEPIQVRMSFGSATISYDWPLCNRGTMPVNHEGITGGIYSAEPAGIYINPESGEINLDSSMAGDYTVTYSFISNECPKEVYTQITIYEVPDPLESVTADRLVICSGETGNLVLSAQGGEGDSIAWYSQACGENFIGSGSQLVIPIPTSTTTYFARWEDVCGPTDCSEVTVQVMSPVVAQISGSSQVSCFNASDGSVSVTASGGSGNYTYSLNGGPAQSSGEFSGLASGSYSVVVNDEYGCSAQTSALVIANPDQIQASVSASSQVSCNEDADGVLSVSASGGTGSLSYSLNGGPSQSSGEFSGLPSGSYSVVVSDENGCSIETPIVIISNPDQIVASISASSQVTCHDYADGAVSVIASGGTGLLSYSLNGGPVQSSGEFSGLISGTYSVVISDENGCSVETSSVLIFNPDQVIASISASSQVSCHDDTDGAVSVIASGGTGSLSYSLNGGIAQSSGEFSGLPSGSYSVVVSDENGCSVETSTEIITNPDQVVASISASPQVTCHDDADGSVSVIASGGTGLLSYSLNGGPAQSSGEFSGLISGTYSVVVSDENGCSVETSSIIVFNPAQVIASISASSQVSCHDDADGFVSVIASGGTGSLSFSLNGGPAQSSGDFPGLISGSYSVVVSDENGCSVQTSTEIIANPDQVVASISASPQVSCHDYSDGFVIVEASGGTGALSFSLNGGPAQSTGEFNDLPSGLYSVVVADQNGCSVQTSEVFIQNPDAVEGYITASPQVSCTDVTDGVVTVVASGGTGFLLFSLNGGDYQESNTFENLSAGIYTVTVTDAMGCTLKTNKVIIFNPSPIKAGIDGTLQVSCHNSSDGIVITDASGGTGTLLYSLNGGEFQESNVFTNLEAGYYWVEVIDSYGCSMITDSLFIANPDPVTASAEGSPQVSCTDVHDGSITVTASGGTGLLSYSLNGLPAQYSNEFPNLPAGTYIIDVFDENLCTAQTSAVVIFNPSQVVASIEASPQVSCHDYADGTVSVTASGGTGALSFSLNNGPAQSSGEFNNLSSGFYSVVVTDENGCSVETSEEFIQNPEAVQGSITASPQVSCTDVTDGVVTVEASGGTGSLLFSINGVDFQESNVFENLSAGIYTVTVTDEMGCTVRTNKVLIMNPSPIKAGIDGTLQVSCHDYSDGMVFTDASGGTGTLYYSLNGGEFQESPDFGDLSSGYYWVEVIDSNGCSMITDSLFIANPEPVEASISASSQVSCHNYSDGTVSVIASGGTGALSYSLNGGVPQPSGEFSNLTFGTYSVVVSDENGCSVLTSEVFISNPEMIQASISASSQVSCADDMNGSVVVEASGGTGELLFSLNGGAPQSSGVFEGLSSGSYSVVVFDANGCSILTDDVLIENPSNLSATISASSQVSCHNDSDGIVTVTASGGTGTLWYSLNEGIPQESNEFSGLPSGVYFAIVSDINGCSFRTGDVFIDNPLQVEASISASSQVSCHDYADGTVSVTASGGTGALSFSINGGDFQPSGEFSGLSSGNYSVVVSDENGCSVITNDAIIANPDQVVASISASSQVSCHDYADGTVTVTASGGTGAFSFSLNGGDPQSSEEFSGLSSGSYSVVVSDENGCSVLTDAAIIANPDQVVASISASSQVSCHDYADGAVSVVASGGTGSLSFSLNGGDFQTSGEFSGLSSGSYSVVVSDENGCSVLTEDAIIANPDQIVASISASPQVSCHDYFDGSVSVIASGGTGSLSYELNNGLIQSSGEFTGIPAGVYFVIVSDENGCSVQTADAVIANPDAVTASISGSSQVSCHNYSDGVVVVEAAGGTGSLSYSLNGNSGQNSGVFEGLPSGSYSVIVSDQNGCAIITPVVTISNPSAISASISASSQVSCNGYPDGSVSVIASGGTGALSFSLNGGPEQSSGEFLGLPSGSYSVLITDENGCSVTTSEVVIENPDQIIASISASLQVSCFDYADGIVSVSASGGTGELLYSLNGADFVESNEFSQLSSGSYSVVVSDINGCTVTTPAVFIKNPDPLGAFASASSQVSCHDYADGVVTISPYGGTGAYSYSINGFVFQESNVFSGLSSGNYSFVVTDERGCIFVTQSSFISNPDPVSASIEASSQVSCHDYEDGMVSVNASGGTGELSYSLNHGAFQQSSVFEGLASGDYWVVVSDENGCSVTTNTETIDNPQKLMVSLRASSQVSCFDSSDGEIEVSASGGTGALSYSLNGGVAQSSNFFSGLASGSYVVMVTDENGCSVYSKAKNILNPDPVVASISASPQVSCHNSLDGSVNVTASGGTGELMYSLNNGLFQSSNEFSGLSSGVYSVIVSDENGCSVMTTEAIISNPDQLIASISSSSQVSCNNASDGFISVSATGGTGELSYSLNGGEFQSSNVFSGLPAGMYNVVVKDEKECIAVTSAVIIMNPSRLKVSIDVSDQVTCYDYEDGVVHVNVEGGTGDIMYSLNGIDFQESNIFSELPAGSYSVIVTDENGCSAVSDPEIILNPSQLQASIIASSQVSCTDVSTGMVMVNASGGTGLLTYSLNGGILQESGVFSGLPSGTYSALITDGLGCNIRTEQRIIANPAPLSAYVEVKSPITCKNTEDGSVVVIASGGTGQLTYILNNDISQISNVFSGLGEGSHSIQILDANGCITDNAFMLESPDQLELAYEGFCKDRGVGVDLFASGGTPPYSFSIDGGQTFFESNHFDQIIDLQILNLVATDKMSCMSKGINVDVDGLNTMEASANVLSENKCFGIEDAAVELNVSGGVSPYLFTLSDGRQFIDNVISGIGAGYHDVDITDANGCPAAVSFRIDEGEQLAAEIRSLSNLDCEGNIFGSTRVEGVGGIPPYDYSWSNGEIGDEAFSLDYGVHTVSIVDANNCQVTQDIIMRYGELVYEPEMNNVFSPNGDGKNDYWVIDNLELFPENELVVINRWGNEVLTDKNYRNDWDGSNLGEGTYYYIFKVKMCGDYKIYDGYVTILR